MSHLDPRRKLSRPAHRRRAPGALIVAAALAACAHAPAGDGAPAAADPAYARVIASEDIDGEVVGPAASETTVTAVVVFASWCGACRRELALLSRLAREQPALRLIGVSAYETWGERGGEDRLRALLADLAPAMPVVRADDGLLADLGGVRKVPSLFVYDRRGRLHAAFRPGRRDSGEDAIRRAVREAETAGAPSPRLR